MWNNLKPTLDRRAAKKAQAAPKLPPPPPPAPPPAAAPAPPLPANATPPVASATPPGPPGAAPPGGNSGAIEQAVTQALVNRAKMLTPEEGQTFFNGITVPALLVLKKMLPEIAPAIDAAIAKKQGGGAPGGPMPGAPVPGAAPGGPQQQAQSVPPPPMPPGLHPNVPPQSTGLRAIG